MNLAIRMKVRYAAPPNSQIKDALRLFKTPRWVQSITQYIIPHLNSVSPAALHVVDALKSNLVSAPECDGSCVVCMEAMPNPCVELPCQHRFHTHCIETWLNTHNTCPACRAQLPMDAASNYSVYAINTTIILPPCQARLPTADLLKLSASNQIIRAMVHVRVRRSVPTGDEAALRGMDGVSEHAGQLPTNVPVPLVQSVENLDMNASVIQRDPEVTGCITEPVVPMIPRQSSRRRCREEEELPDPSTRKRVRLRDASEERETLTSV